MASLQLVKVRQRFKADRLEDVEAALRQALRRLGPVIRPKARIAVAVGSRGIADITAIVKTAVEYVREHAGEPFIVPAMGSHGGATAIGQARVLENLGVTEDAVGAPVRSSMEVVQLPCRDGAIRLFMDRYACESDGVIVINRVKPHTDYRARYESGLAKMCVIGLGKHKQALEVHRFGIRGLKELVPAAAERILATGKILAGIAVVENARHETMLVRALKAGDIMTEEPGLLDTAKANMPRLPVEKIDVLIVDRIGKDISGVGLDPDIIGRMRIRGQAEPVRPDITSIVVCDLTEESHGNALGTGLADVTTRKLFDKIDFCATYENVYTSTFLERAKIPAVAINDEEAFDCALRSCGPIPGGEQKIIRIQDTLRLDEICVSRAVLNEISGRDDIEAVSDPVDVFDTNGELVPF